MSLVETVLQAPNFKKAAKKLHKNQKADLDLAIRFLVEQPLSGEQKKGNLAYLRVYKFKMVNQETLLGYSYEENQLILELLALGSHENFYRDLKS